MASLTGEPRWHEFWLALVGFLVLTFAVAGIGGAVTAGSVEHWYPTLVKPAINPPNWVFGPVWTVLYLMMAVAAALAWTGAHGGARKVAIGWFVVQLALNLGWSILFFGLHRIAPALACLILLWLAIAATIRLFWPINRAAGLLLVPYLLWVSFAGLLNFLIWRLN